MKKIYSLFTILVLATGISAQTYTENFEAAPTKTAYASSNVNLNGITWNLTDTIITNAAASDPDWFNGTRSLRLRGYGSTSFAMQDNKVGGIGNITFSYRRYGTDTQNTYNVDWSSNGSTWTTIGTFTPTATVQTFNYALNQSAARIRIVATISGGSNRRANLDDITLTDNSGSLAVVEFDKSSVNFVKNTSVNNVIYFGSKAEVKVYSLNGQILKTASVSESKSLNVADLQSGVYIITGLVKGKNVSQKIIKN